MTEITACVIIIGNEILSGRTQDQNLSWIAQRLSAMGIRLAEARVVRDIDAEIIETVNACRRKYTYVFTTGGIGPTHDDITAASIAKAFGVSVARNSEAVQRLAQYYGNQPLTDARLRMANVPEGAALIDNPASGAPGFRLENVYVMAGVPHIMQAMFDGFRHTLVQGPPILSKGVSCSLKESAIAVRLEAIQKDFPDLDVGSYPFYRDGHIGTTLVVRGQDPAAVEAAAVAVEQMIRDLGDTPVREQTHG
ncbi:MAG: molybdopterin-binding protein [Pseudomonadota bacterium]|nr:molybdopterin-binding protein [Pseudomonadota bacterium]